MNGKIAFCFHHAEASGASLWMKSFLLQSGMETDSSIVLFPSPSPLEAELADAGFACASLSIEQVSFAGRSAAAKLALLRNRISAVGEYRRLFRREGVRLVYVNSSVQIAPMIAAKLEGIPFVVHVHEAWVRSRTFFLKKFFVRNLAAGAIFAARRGIDTFGGTPSGKPWIFSPNGLDPEVAELGNHRTDFRQKHGMAENEIVFLFLGTLQALKGLQDLLRVWRGLQNEFVNIRLLVAGRVDEHDTDPEITRFLESGLPKAEMLGFRSDARELVAAADYMVLPSYGEAMPLAVVEAMMIGTPVIARDVGDLPWLLGDDRGYIFYGPGEAPLVEAVKKALHSPHKRDAIIRRARAFALEHLTREKQCAQIREFLSTFIR